MTLRLNDKLYRVKTRAVFSVGNGIRMHNDEITEIELLPPTASTRHDAYTTVESNSISQAKLVENVELSYEGGIYSEGIT